MSKKEYTITLYKLQRMKTIAEELNLTLDRQMKFDEQIKYYLDELIKEIENEGTEAKP